MRLLLDTNIFVYMVSDKESLTKDVYALLEDPANLKYISQESVRELVVAYRSKRLLSKYWHSEREMVDYIWKSPIWKIDMIDYSVMQVFADLDINLAQSHNDPSDHIIISQAIAHKMMLVSSDTKFPFYRNQGLLLTENR